MKTEIREKEMNPCVQATCEHEWSAKMVSIFAGTVGRVCKKCGLRSPTRDATKEEWDNALSNF